MKVDSYNMKGEKKEKVELKEEVFGIQPNLPLVHQAYLTQLANMRVVLAHTKTRSEVRGGGRKPWRQKGTGRARAGSIRSPIFKGGGVVFGPRKERNFQKKLPKKALRLAIKSVLSDKLKEDKIKILSEFDFKEFKTKKMLELLNNLGIKDSVLFVLPERNLFVEKSIDNIPWAKFSLASQLNVFDLLKYDFLLTTKEGIKKIEEIYGK